MTFWTLIFALSMAFIVAIVVTGYGTVKGAVEAIKRGAQGFLLKPVTAESLQKAIAAHDSPAYQEALRALGDGAERDLRIVEGVS